MQQSRRFVAGRALKKPLDGFADQLVTPGECGERFRQAMSATIDRRSIVKR